MEVYVVQPFGYCKGVQQAIVLAERAKQENPKIPVYLLGMLVHNEETIEELSRQGILFLDEKDGPLEELIQRIPDGSAIVFSAHGHAESLDEIAKEKHLRIYDATCSFVKENLSEAREAGKSSPIIYLGVNGHLESQAFQANYPGCFFYDVGSGEGDWEDVRAAAPHLISQTTLSDSEIAAAHAKLKERYPDLMIGKERCRSTSLRQDAIRKLPKDIDLVIVLGSSRSNNSRKLFEIAQEEGRKAVLALGLEEIRKIDLSNAKKVALASGASTSPSTFKACHEYLKRL